MPWFKVDDKLHDHRKARRAKKAAMGVWVLAGSWCGDNLTDGFVPADILPRWGNTRDATTLVDAGLWHVHEQDGEPGWLFHNWAEFQPTKAQVEEESRRKAEAGRKGGRASGRSRREAGAKAGASQVVEPRPDPSRPVSVVAHSSQSQADPITLSTDGLDRVKKLTRGTVAHANACAAFVLAKAPGDVRNPDAYVIAAITDDPDAYRYKRGNPKKDQECPIHAGQWADACAGCAADRKAAS